MLLGQMNTVVFGFFDHRFGPDAREFARMTLWLQDPKPDFPRPGVMGECGLGSKSVR